MKTKTRSVAAAEQRIAAAYPHRVRRHIPNAEQALPIREWCAELCGGPNGVRIQGMWVYLDTDTAWCQFNMMFWFKDQDHAFEFKMRWV